MNNFFDKFVPKEPKFFPILKEMADVILEASDLIIECIKNYSHESAIEYYRQIKDQERKGDALSAKIFNELNSTFITPFDREDIHHLADKLDDVTDYINNCAKRIVLYNPKQLPDSTLQLSLLIKEGAIGIGKAVDQLDVMKKHSNKVKEYCTELHVIENKADDVYENFLIALFSTEKDSIEIIKLKEIMSELEKATDSADSVGKIIKTIIVKYA